MNEDIKHFPGGGGDRSDVILNREGALPEHPFDAVQDAPAGAVVESEVKHDE